MDQKNEIFLVDGSHYDRLRSVFEAPLDLKKISTLASGGRSITRAIYYRDIRDPREEERQRPLFGWLEHNGFEVRGRELDPAYNGPRERYGTNLIEMAVDAILLAKPGDRFLILAADIKLMPLLRALNSLKVEVTLISTLNAPQTIAPSSMLTALVKNFIDLDRLDESIVLPKREDGPSNNDV
jgi:uncharacterized LabA/DUF88 family protein